MRLIIVIIIILFTGCWGPTSDGKYNRPFLGFEGKYCAKITYYNPHSKITRSFYNYIEAEEDDLIIIHWPNGGGQIDLDHMDNQVYIDRKGYAAFRNNEGYEYKVQIVSNNCQF